MIRVFSAPTHFLVYNMKNILESYGIDSKIVGENRAAAVGEIPPIEAWIELHVNEEDEKKALEIIDVVIKDPIDEGDAWTCPECGEEIEPQFSTCWNCGTDR
jgi:hypothetical protein